MKYFSSEQIGLYTVNFCYTNGASNLVGFLAVFFSEISEYLLTNSEQCSKRVHVYLLIQKYNQSCSFSHNFDILVAPIASL